MARDLDVQHETAWVLSHKLREAMAAEMASHTLNGTVEVDAFIGGHIRPENVKADRKNRRLSEHQTGKRRVVVVARQGGGRTLPTVHHHESDGIEAIAPSLTWT